VDEIVLSLYAKGLTTGEISSHFAEIYDASVSRETISVRVKDSSRPARKRPDFQFWCEQVHWFRPAAAEMAAVAHHWK
jgi:hypothetical protein